MGGEMTERELRDRELHHFETEQENARLQADIAAAQRLIDGYREEREHLLRQLAQPPKGWYTFGAHIDRPDVELEFWGDDHGVPIWERPRG